MHFPNLISTAAERICAVFQSPKRTWNKHKATEPIHAPDLPPSVTFLLAHQNTWESISEADTPLSSLYRIYECFVIDDVTDLRNEIESFFDCWSWRVADIPNPKDPDPARYAILAVMTRFLVLAFNRKIGYGIPRNAPAIVGGRENFKKLAARPKQWEKQPRWAAKVPPMKHRLVIPRKSGAIPQSKQQASKDLLKKNIWGFKPHIYFM